ncbi:MAG TPA: [Fe-Fe] hydrogenase large subunit C-terminal domain-containing protein [bacterium]|nr:[Fe-Fe] hydrogenase large subunit C-terminal domain-containing protein [bacterium]HPN46051.1 [Fe-Fe] hydrogenase large subunit C-terminal domain-containing protein [bacterium]
MSPVVTTIETRCKRCYSCIRNCPAKAIKVEKGQAQVIAERCIACGYCVRVCPQNAKSIRDDILPVMQLLSTRKNVYALLAPSFPAAFPDISPAQVLTAIRQLGFARVFDVAFGADLVSFKYKQLLEANVMPVIISSPCPAVVSYIEKYYPFLSICLAPVVSPMIAVGRYIKKNYGGDNHLVFIGPCIAKKREMIDNKLEAVIDCVLTFDELKAMFDYNQIQLADLSNSEFDGPRGQHGKLFPVSGGLLKSAGIDADITDNDIIVTEGRDRVLEIISKAAEGEIEAKFLDILFCEGCINGPKIDNSLSVFVKKDRVINYIKEQSRLESPREISQEQIPDTSRQFTNEYKPEKQPGKADIKRILAMTGKMNPEDELNCGACGYPSCYEKAVAVFRGLAEAEMCLPYMIDKLEQVQNEAQKSNQELKESLDTLRKTQQQLVQSEKLASIGELAAGVAHELNNPLGGILIFTNLLMEKKNKTDQDYTDLKRIVDETERCRKIVQGLLDFSRQSRTQAAITDLNKILTSTLSLIERQAIFQNIEIVKELQGDIDKVFVDVGQIQQIFLNIILNAAEAMQGNGQLVVKTDMSPDRQRVMAIFTDTGPGIADEIKDKIFDPFFTTKPPGKGTGLGLAISYGIIQKHQGEISVSGKAGEGATFTVFLPTARAMQNNGLFNQVLLHKESDPV